MKHSISSLSFVMALATVFIVRPELGSGIVSGKYFWFYLSMGVIAVVSLVDSLTRRQAMRIKRIDGLILLYGVCTLSVSYFLHSSEAVTKHILLILIILLYFYFRMFLSASKSNGYWPVLFFLVTGLAEALWGLRQLYGLEHSQHALFQLTGSFFNPGPYACYLAVVLPAAFGYLLRDRNCTQVRFKLRYWPLYLRWGIALLTCAGVILVLPAAMSRSSWLAAIGGCGFVAFFHWKQKGFRGLGKIAGYGRWILSGVLVLCILGGIGMYRMKKDSADGRALTWKIALQTAVHHPLGVGIGYFSGSYGHEQADRFAAGKGTEQEQHVAGNPEYGFNEYLQIAVEQGVIPFLLFLGIMGYSIYAGIRQRRIAATASLSALLIAAITSYPFSVLPFLIVMAFLLAWIHSGKCDTGKRSFPPVLSSIFIFIVAGCLYNRYPTYQAYKQWGRSKALYHTGAYGSGAKAYAPLYPLLADQLDFLFEYAQCLSKSEQYAESNAVLEKAVKIRCDPMLYNVMGKNCQALKRYAEAEQCFLKAANIVPSRIYPWYLLANLYVEMGETEKARETARIVLTKEPKVQSTAVREMREKMKEIVQDSKIQKHTNYEQRN
ncbi:MAG: O-antigen ligase family protein [Prevotellaceae bacterium]|jgi:tetratricopeptide (TPR) repeat protein|nr:O-antigen ligase family protein [Prevotellaceae bacterium]